MGWRDINMSRRKPPLRLAVIPMEVGEDAREAVLRKSARAAIAAMAQAGTIEAKLMPFAAGYLAGYARHQALRHGVDAEQGDDIMQSLLAALAAESPRGIAREIEHLNFVSRTGARSARATLRAKQGLADAGYLVGHLESLCRSEKLLAAGLQLIACGDIEAFLTACDFAADRMQTHQPTMALRFDAEERAILREALS